MRRSVAAGGSFRRILTKHTPMLADQSVFSIVKWSLLLVVFIVIGWVTVWQVRRRLTKADETSGAGFTLSDLRQLHKSGQMSDAEFERAKARVVDAAKRAAQRELTEKSSGRSAAATGPGAARRRAVATEPPQHPDTIVRPPDDGGPIV